MKDLFYFFNELSQNSGAIWVEDNDVYLSAPKNFENQKTYDFIKNNKTQISSVLKENNISSKEKFISKTIFRDTISSNYPLSPAQERLWFIEQYAQGSNAYHMPVVFELDQDTDVSGIKYALQQIIARHEVLRSTIEQGEDQEHGIQIVRDEPLPIEEVVVSPEQDYKPLIKEEINRPFNLSVEYPVRVKFYFIESAKPSAENPHSKILLLINVHHIACDGWSMDIFDKELLAYYEAYMNKDTHFSLPALQIQYKDYAVWQRAYLAGAILEKQLNYWKSKLMGFQTLALPTDRLRPAEIDYKGSGELFTLGLEISERLRALAQRNGVTLHSVLLSSINILLSKYTGQEDIVTGSPTANRHHQQTEGLIGFFVNMQANRTVLNRSQSFEELVQQVHEEQIEAQLNQDLPLEKLVDELGMERDLSRHPVFQVMFSVQSFGTQAEATDQQKNYLKPFWKGAIYDVYAIEKFDLSIFMDDSQPELKGHIGYATSLFDKDTIERLIHYYVYLLEQLTQKPEQAYSQLSLLNTTEYDQILNKWNTTGKDYPNDKTIHQLFQEQVARTPDHIALVFEEQELTYRELDEKTNQLARYIRAQYQQRTNQPLLADTLIVLYLNRSFEMVIGILAVLKAGGAYLPMDIAYPQERVDYLLEDSGAELILSQRQLNKKTTTELPQEKVIYIDATENLYQEEDKSELPQYSKATDLAYVIYTSGTTGKPKGVLQMHSNVMRLFTCTDDQFNFNADDVWTLFHSYVFDFSVWELWGSLIYGGKLIILSREQTRDTERFYQLCKQHKVTVLNQTPTAFYRFMDVAKHIDQADLFLKYIIFGGEALNIKQLEPWWNYQTQHHLNTQLINMYGITETTVHVTYKELANTKSPQSNIGKPIADLKAYILDGYNKLVPIGVVGELHVGGAGLARGYLNRRELTKERFIPNPFASELDIAKGHTRLYKTGDLVRWLPNGDLEYIGRNDDQVKIRGYRIELGEIEYALTQIEGIKQSCVLTKESKRGTGHKKYLVGYYVLGNSEDQLTQATIEKRLLQMLPDYMVPSAYVAMDSFPLTINGKLDKQALPVPDISASEEQYAAPTTEAETMIASVWQEVLGADQISITDDFFRIGGDSILSIQVSGRIRQIGFNCQVKDIFECRTIAKLAKHLDQNKSKQAIKSEQGILTGELEFLPIQQWFVEKVESGAIVQPNHWNQSFLIRVPQLDPSKLESIIPDLVAYHDVLRIQYQRTSATDQSIDKGLSRWKQSYRESISIPELKTLDLSKHDEAEIQDIMTSWQNDFDLEQGPLFQMAYLYGYEDGSARIFFALHHLIVDGVSWRILAEDLKALYEGRTLPLKGSSYRQWATVIKDYTKEHAEEALWWDKQMDAIAEDQPLRPRNETTFEVVELDKALTQSILQEASKAYHTEINDLLLTALAYALKNINQKEVQTITLEGHGREDINPTIDISRTVGWFTSMFPVKLELQNSLGESIQSIKEYLHNIPNKGIGFGAFAMDKENSFSGIESPLISFNYLGQFDTLEGDWQIVAEGSGASIHSSNVDQNWVNINGMVSNGQLVFSIMTKLGEDTTKRLSKHFKIELIKIIDHCKVKLEKEGSTYTPSDFYHVKHEGDLTHLPLLKNAAKMHEPFLMTEIQKAYLLGRLDDFEIGGVSNHVYHEFKFASAIDIPKLEGVINFLIQAKPELRTVFDVETLTQQYMDIDQLQPYQVNINDNESNYSEDQLLPIRNELSHLVYEANQYPLFTFEITRFNDCDILHFSMDLILLDAESRQNFFKELTRLYQSDTLTLTAAPLHFKDYQDYIVFLKHSKWYTNDKKYWSEKLSKLPLRPELFLKTDPKTIVKPKFDMSVQMIEEPIWTKFKNKCEVHGISPSAALLSLFGYVLSRYSATKDFLITLTVFNRYSIHPDVNGIWGDFTSTNLFGYKTGQGSIKDLLSLTHQDLWNDLGHGLFNGLEVLRELQNRHQLDPYQSVSPIVFTGRVGGNSNQPQEHKLEQHFLDPSEDTSSRVWMAQTSQAWIDLQAIEMDNQFCSGWMYVEQLFDKEFIDELNTSYCNLIKYLGESDWETPLPSIGLSALDQSVITTCNSDEQAAVSETLVDLCLSSIVDHSTRTAVIDAKGTYSYKQVGAYSYHIAGYLQDNDLSKSGQLIGVLSEKGYGQVVSTLGIMQSGSAYLPLHVDWPLGRLDEVLAEGLVQTVLVSDTVFTKYIKGSKLEAKYIWLLIETIINYEPVVSLSELPKVDLDDIAYVIFTSGSTGKPKGVTISHRGAINTIVAVNSKFEVTKEDKVLCLSELSFDLSVYDIFGLLGAGGTLVFPDQEKTKEPSHWNELIETHGITLWNTVPQLMQLLVDYVLESEYRLASLRAVLMSGDWIPVGLPDQIKSLNEGVCVMSLGGATEGSIWSIWYEVEDVAPSWRSIPYGVAMPNQKMYVLNDFMEHCPMGVMGEIHIGGEGVALGYWGDEEQSNARFIETEDLGRLYKTGDLGRWNSEGYIEFEGRKDTQVKLNGYRVELEEISSKLTKINGIDKSLVSIQDNQLVAYLVSEKYATKGEKEDKNGIDKVAFKFEQKGIRKEVSAAYQFAEMDLEEKNYRLRKSYRQFESGQLELTKEEITRLLQPNLLESASKNGGQKSSWITRLKELLKPLSALQLEDKVLPKYLYPSGGSTYAIQCYVEIGEEVVELHSGCYYYEPVSHYLSAIEKDQWNSNGQTSAPIRLKFKLYQPAIEPLYGEMGLKLAWLEMGHILSLLDQQCQGQYLDGQLSVLDKQEGDYHELIELSIDLAKDQAVHKPFDFNLEEGSTGASIDYLRKRKEGFSDDEGHEYLLSGHDLMAKISDLGQLLESADGLLLFKGSTAPKSLLQSGYQAQRLTESLYEKEIGSCVLGFAPYDEVNYTIAIGRMSEEQKEASEIQAKKVSVAGYLKSELQEYLPAYMLPEYYIPLAAFPLTGNGKVDYKRLPKIEIRQEEYVKPTTEIEASICELWEEILGLERVGITDDFFRIGGNSILAIQVSHQMSKALERELKVADVFRLKSIEQILNNLQISHQQNFNLVKPYHLKYNKTLTDLIMIHPGNAGSEVYQKLADELIAKYNCIGIDNHNIHHQTKIGSLNKLANHYLSEYEMIYSHNESINLLGWSLGGQIALEMAAILELRGYKNINVILLDTLLPDQTVRNLRNQVSNEEYIIQLENLTKSKDLEKGYFEKVISAIDAERDLANSFISKRLKESNVIFFKATEEDKSINTVKFKLLQEHSRTLIARNVDLAADKVEVIEVNCNHLNILETNGEFIIEFILNELKKSSEKNSLKSTF